MFVATGMWIVGGYLFTSQYAKTLEASSKEASQRLELYNEIIYETERQLLNTARMALEQLGSEVGMKEAVLKLSAEQLGSMVRELGIGDISFIDREGHVFACTSSSKPRNDVFAQTSRELQNRLLKIIGRGSLLTQREAFCSYLFYSPKDSDFLMEASLSLDTFISNLILNESTSKAEAKKFTLPLVRIVDLMLVSDGQCWSLNGIHRSRDDLVYLVSLAEKEGGIKVEWGNNDIQVLRLKSYHETPLYGVLESDHTPLLFYNSLVFSVFLGTMILSIGILYIILKKGLLQRIANAVEHLAECIDSMEGQQRTDSIDHLITDLSEALRDKTQALSIALDNRAVLLHEIYHRVKNNLQIILSLINLRLTAPLSRDAIETLSVLRDHIYTIDLVEEQIHTKNNPSPIILEKFCEELARSVLNTFPGRNVDLQVCSDETFLTLSSDKAVPLGIIITESVINSLKHGFSLTKRGRISILCTLKDTRYIITIKDDGRGRASLVNKNGIGLILMRALASQLSGDLIIENDIGWTVEITFQIK